MTDIIKIARKVIALEDDGNQETWDLYAESAHPLAKAVESLVRWADEWQGALPEEAQRQLTLLKGGG